MVTAWGLVLVQVYWLLMVLLLCPSSLTYTVPGVRPETAILPVLFVVCGPERRLVQLLLL